MRNKITSPGRAKLYLTTLKTQLCWGSAYLKYQCWQPEVESYVSVISHWVHAPLGNPEKIFLNERILATRAIFFV